jgi:hypothetical protein
MRNHSLREEQYALEVDVLDPVPVARLDIEEFHRLGNAGVIDQDVDLTEGVGDSFHGLHAGGLIGHVAGNSDMSVAKVLRGGLCGGPIDIEDCYPSALFGKPSGGREANPAGRSRTCNNGCFAAKQHSILPVSSSRRCGKQPALLISFLSPGRFRDKRAVVLDM